jgi:hypothetical protein
MKILIIAIIFTAILLFSGCKYTSDNADIVSGSDDGEKDMATEDTSANTQNETIDNSEGNSPPHC